MNQKTKVCKHCQSEIPKKAKICPNCHKKQGGKLKWIVIVIFAMGIIGSLMDDGEEDKKRTESKPKQEASVETAKSDSKSNKNSDSKKKSKKKKKKSKSAETPNPESESQQEDKPAPVPVENSVVLYYMDLYENYESYKGQYVTISAPLSYADGDTVDVKGDISGATGMINITLLEPRNDLKEGDFVTATGRIDEKALGYLYMKDANISQTGDGSAQIYNQQKAEYDALSAQKAQQDVANFKASCETLNYEDILRNPDANKDRNCVVSGVVDQIIEGWFGAYTIFVTDSAGNKWGCVYSYKEGESHLLEGDGVTVYGKCSGTENTKTLLGQQVTLPRVDVEYIN